MILFHLTCSELWHLCFGHVADMFLNVPHQMKLIIMSSYYLAELFCWKHVLAIDLWFFMFHKLAIVLFMQDAALGYWSFLAWFDGFWLLTVFKPVIFSQSSLLFPGFHSSVLITSGFYSYSLSCLLFFKDLQIFINKMTRLSTFFSYTNNGGEKKLEAEVKTATGSNKTLFLMLKIKYQSISFIAIWQLCYD